MKIHAFGPIASCTCGPREQHADASSCGLSRLGRQDLDPELNEYSAVTTPISDANQRSSV